MLVFNVSVFVSRALFVCLGSLSVCFCICYAGGVDSPHPLSFFIELLSAIAISNLDVLSRGIACLLSSLNLLY